MLRLPRRGLDAGGHDLPRWPAAFATVSTLQPRTAAVPRRLRHGLDVGCRGPPRWPASLAAVSTPAAEIRPISPRWPAAFATVSTPAAEDRLFGRPPSQRSRRRRRGPPRWPASLAAVSAPAAEDRRGGPPPSPRSRRRRPRSAAVPCRLRHGLDAGGRGTPQRRPRSLLFNRSFEKVARVVWAHCWRCVIAAIEGSLAGPCGYCVRMCMRRRLGKWAGYCACDYRMCMRRRFGKRAGRQAKQSYQ